MKRLRLKTKKRSRPSRSDSNHKPLPEDREDFGSRSQRALRSYSGSRRMDWTENRKYWIRLAPLGDDALIHPFAELPELGCISYPVHRGIPMDWTDDQGETKTVDYKPVLCSANRRDKRTCLICRYQKLLSNLGRDGDEESGKDAKRLRADKHHIANIYVYETGQFYRERLNYSTAKWLVGIAEDAGDLSDPENGLDVRIQCFAPRSRKFQKYIGPADTHKSTRRQPIPDDGWKDLESVLVALDYVETLEEDVIIEKLVDTYGRMEGDGVFG